MGGKAKLKVSKATLRLVDQMVRAAVGTDGVGYQRARRLLLARIARLEEAAASYRALCREID